MNCQNIQNSNIFGIVSATILGVSSIAAPIIERISYASYRMLGEYCHSMQANNSLINTTCTRAVESISGLDIASITCYSLSISSAISLSAYLIARSYRPENCVSPYDFNTITPTQTRRPLSGTNWYVLGLK